MLLCPSCQREFESVYRFCPLDGRELIPQSNLSDPLPPEEIKGRYRLVKKLAADRIEILYEAYDRIEQRPVFLRLFSRDFMAGLRSPERFRTEALLARTITHPSLVQMYDLEIAEDGRYFLVTEPVPGVPLNRWLAAGPLYPAHAVAIMREVGSLLLETHGQGLYHGHLSPAAIFILNPEARPAEIKVVGCGIGRFSLAYWLQLMESGMADSVNPDDVGYVPPELLGGQQESLINEHVDIYSFGVILYEALVGALPFQVDTSQGMLDAHMLLEPIAMSNLVPNLHLPAALDDLVLHCMAKAPNKRFASIEDLLAALEPIHQFLESTMPPRPLHRRGSESSRVRPPAPTSFRSMISESVSDSETPTPVGKDFGGDPSSAFQPGVAATAVSTNYADAGADKRPAETTAPTQTEIDQERQAVPTLTGGSAAETVTPTPAAVLSDKVAPEPSEALTSREVRQVPRGPTDETAGLRAFFPGKNMKFITALISLVVLAVVAFCGTLAWVINKPKHGKVEIKTTPAGATIYVDGQRLGNTPFVDDRFVAGKHSVKLTKEGYQEWVKEFVLKPDSEQVIEPALQPMQSSKLPPEQQRKVAELMRKAEMAMKENILIPPPDNYNALYFCEQILAIDPTDTFARDMRDSIQGKYRAMAAEAYDQSRWFEAERHYQSLAALFPNDEAIKQRLVEVAAKIDETKKDKEKRIAELTVKIKQSLQAGALAPPDPDNAIENVTALLRLNAKDSFGRQSRNKILELLRQRAENKIAASNFDGAKMDYLAIQRYFPSDKTAAGRLDLINRKLIEMSKGAEKKPVSDPELQRRERLRALRQSGIESSKAGDYAAAIQSFEEAKKLDGSDFETAFMLAGAYKERRQFDQAISNYQHAVSIYPNNGSAHFNLARLYESYLHDTARARQHYGKALQLGATEMPADRLRKLIAALETRERLAALESMPIAVVHRHISGNCRGNLFLSNGQVRYDTPHANDHFAEPFSNVVTDIKKDGTLTVQVKKGRRYNFQVLNDQDLSLLRQRLGKD